MLFDHVPMFEPLVQLGCWPIPMARPYGWSQLTQQPKYTATSAPIRAHAAILYFFSVCCTYPDPVPRSPSKLHVIILISVSMLYKKLQLRLCHEHWIPWVSTFFWGMVKHRRNRNSTPRNHKSPPSHCTCTTRQEAPVPRTRMVWRNGAGCRNGEKVGGFTHFKQPLVWSIQVTLGNLPQKKVETNRCSKLQYMRHTETNNE